MRRSEFESIKLILRTREAVSFNLSQNEQQTISSDCEKMVRNCRASEI